MQFEVQYILLDCAKSGKAKDMPNVVAIDNMSSQLDRSGRLIDNLISEGHKKIWAVEVDKIFRELKRVSVKSIITAERALSHGPEKFKTIDCNKTPDLQNDSIARALVDTAKKICNRKTVFLFPDYWSKELDEFKDKLVDTIAFNVAEFFREAEADADLPWTFLSLNMNSEISSPLMQFIRSLHGLMLRDTGSMDVELWSQKSGTILLSGPTGSGKSYAAKLLSRSPKYKSKLIEVNLAAVSESLLESRMRGFNKGEFTGAIKDRMGWFEEADGGVLFFDEFQSTPNYFQVQLLDILSAVSDRVEIARIGADNIRKEFSVKVIIAINEELDVLLSQKRLRKDIFYRIRNVQSFPTLKERLTADTRHRYLRGLITTYRWKSLLPINIGNTEKLDTININRIDVLPTYFPSFTSESLAELAIHDWEGNFRELERVAFDLFFESDSRGRAALIEVESVKRIINSWYVRKSDSVITENSEALSLPERKKLNDIQDALRKSKFIISTFIKKEHQSYIGSRGPLKKYLLENVNNLDSDLINDSRIIKFLRLTR